MRDKRAKKNRRKKGETKCATGGLKKNQAKKKGGDRARQAA